MKRFWLSVFIAVVELIFNIQNPLLLIFGVFCFAWGLVDAFFLAVKDREGYYIDMD